MDVQSFFVICSPERAWTRLLFLILLDKFDSVFLTNVTIGEYVTCVLWSGLYHITGTDIVRALVFRFEAFGRPVRNMKKFEEGVFSDLRNLKPNLDACLEEPKVCIRAFCFLRIIFRFKTANALGFCHSHRRRAITALVALLNCSSSSRLLLRLRDPRLVAANL